MRCSRCAAMWWLGMRRRLPNPSMSMRPSVSMPAVPRRRGVWPARRGEQGRATAGSLETRNTMRVVVTGATGNVGTALLTRLAEDDAVHEIVGISRRPTNWSVPKTTFVSVDVATDDLEGPLEGADAVVHLAWI